MNRRHPVAMSESEEQDAAVRILALEDQVSQQLRLVPVCAAILDRDPDPVGRTRHGAVDRLEEALAAALRDRADTVLLARASSAWHAAQALRWRLAMSGMRVACREARRVPARGIAMEDLEQEGLLGLYGAAQRYEPGRGVRFAVYARWWVRAEITRCVQRAASFQISTASLEVVRNLRKLVSCEEQSGRSRTMAERAQSLGVSPTRLREALAASALRAVDEPEDDDGPSMLGELPDADGRSPEDQASANELRGWVRQAVGAGLTERERHIVEQRNGLAGEARSIAAIAADLSLSAERVRQIERECVAALRGRFDREITVRRTGRTRSAAVGSPVAKRRKSHRAGRPVGAL